MRAPSQTSTWGYIRPPSRPLTVSWVHLSPKWKNYKSICIQSAAAIFWDFSVSAVLPGLRVTLQNYNWKYISNCCRQPCLNVFVGSNICPCLAMMLELIFFPPCLTLKTTWLLGCRLLFREIYGAIMLGRKDLSRWLTRQRLLAVSAIITLAYSSLPRWVDCAWLV